MSKKEDMLEIDSQWNRWGGMRDLVGRKDGTIKEAAVSIVRNSPPDCRGQVIVGAMVDKDKGDVEVRIAKKRGEGGCFDPESQSDVFTGDSNKVQKESHPETFRVSITEAKDFFGTEVVKTAKELNRPIKRLFQINQL